MKIVIATDAWDPQTNGVVTTLKTTVHVLQSMGHEVKLITPTPFKTVPLPSYPSIRLAILPGKKITKELDVFSPDAIHIATEGPIGLSVRKYCLKHRLKFTTSYHTQFPEYLRLRAPVPLGLSYALLKWFHNPAVRTMVPTPSMRERLLKQGFNNIAVWGRGVDVELFTPATNKSKSQSHRRPVFLYTGRVAIEKNIEAFLSLNLPGTKMVIGDGPDLDMLKRKYPLVKYTGFRYGQELAQLIADADVFVFPSLTDTFGLVMLEAMSCGLPVAAFPVTGPMDVIINGVTGVLDNNLESAALRALEINPNNPREYALNHSWKKCTADFLKHLAPNSLTDQPGRIPVAGRR